MSAKKNKASSAQKPKDKGRKTRNRSRKSVFKMHFSSPEEKEAYLKMMRNMNVFEDDGILIGATR